MFTHLDKAIVAAIMAILSILNLGFGWDFGVDEKLVTAIVTAAIPLVVYAWPNKKEDGVRVNGTEVPLKSLPGREQLVVENIAKDAVIRVRKSLIDRLLGR
ncbi:hypothetical protein [Devosia sp. 1635]|uniref:hypothetical protein n=1 Tax=Devosia sp. 1635 TaxID=2726066 RepID=UPI001566115E|nr:hypothetical protein [Devosia sp. 1635]